MWESLILNSFISEDPVRDLMTKTFGHLDKSLPNSREFSLKVEVANFFSRNSQMLAETCALAENISFFIV